MFALRFPFARISERSPSGSILTLSISGLDLRVIRRFAGVLFAPREDGFGLFDMVEVSIGLVLCWLNL